MRWAFLQFTFSPLNNLPFLNKDIKPISEQSKNKQLVWVIIYFMTWFPAPFKVLPLLNIYKYVCTFGILRQYNQEQIVSKYREELYYIIFSLTLKLSIMLELWVNLFI